MMQPALNSIRNCPLESCVGGVPLCLFWSLSFGLLLLVGCSSGGSATEEKTADPIRVSDVPLRVQILSEVLEADLIKRQWLADSDQPIEITAFEAGDSLYKRPGCDVLIYPARRLGDMVRTESVYELPGSVLDADVDEADGEFTSLAGAEKAQATYGGDLYAVPLGLSLTHVIGNKALGEKLKSDASSWDDLLSALPAISDDQSGEGSAVSQPDEVDTEALVDRFLAIAASQVSKNPTYGLLFELQTMKSLLHEDAFIQAASILKRLASVDGGRASVFGSHNEAWQWATSGNEPRVAVLTLTKLSKDVVSEGDGVAIAVTGDKAKTWDTGDGLLASLSINCQQTAQGTEFLKWLRERRTRQSLSEWVVGIDSGAGGGASNRLLQDVYRQQSDWIGSGAIPREPSLPRTHYFRQLLAEELLRIVQGEVDPAVGMQAASDRWTELAASEGSRLRKEFEDSLGLGY